MVTCTLTLSLLTVFVLALQGEAKGVAKRFILDLFDGLKTKECMLCKCYKECHTKMFILVDDDAVCDHEYKRINCDEIDRCTCCPEFFPYPACPHGSQCRNDGHGRFTCLASKQTDYCASAPCQNGGTCSNNPTGFVCQCPRGWGGKSCEADALLNCDHTCSLQTIAKAHPVENMQASVCPGTTSHSTNEALPMECCQAGLFSKWRKGLKVIANGNCNNIPQYTPISEFNGQNPVPGKAGVFLSCLQNGTGFKMITQNCNTAPSVAQIDGTSGGNYHVLY